MRKIAPYVIIGCVLLVLVSCSKEKSIDTVGGKSGAGFAEVGTWKFLFIKSTSSQSVEYNDGVDDYKDVTIRNYISKDNGGTIKFTGSAMTTTGLAFTIDTVVKTYYYINGKVDDSLEAPIAAILPPMNLADGYKKFSADSLSFQTGVLSAVISGGTQTAPTGFKLSFDGDKMMMTSEYSNSKLVFNMGISQRIISHEVNVITLQKQ
jgi:hypothetical protein